MSKFPGGRDPTRVRVVGHNEWRGQSGVACGTNPAHGKKFCVYQRIVVMVKLDETGEKVGFFEGELVLDNALEWLANLEDEE